MKHFISVVLFGFWVVGVSVARADLDDAPVAEPSVVVKKPKEPEPETPFDLGTKDTTGPAKPAEEKPPQPKGEKNPKKGKKDSKEAKTEKEGFKKNEPVHYEGQGLVGNKETGIVDLTKDVIVTQADMRMESDHVKAFTEPKTNEVVKIIADGHVKMFKEDKDPAKKVRATSNEATFYNSERKIILTGNPQLWRGSDLIKGKQIAYELDSGMVRVERVEGVMMPKSDPTPGATTVAPEEPTRAPGK